VRQPVLLILRGYRKQDRRFAGCDPYFWRCPFWGPEKLFTKTYVQSMPTLTEKKRALHTVYAVENGVSALFAYHCYNQRGLGGPRGHLLTILGLPFRLYLGHCGVHGLNFLPYYWRVRGCLLVAGFSLLTLIPSVMRCLARSGYLTRPCLKVRSSPHGW